jgi:hypothetical protein
MPPTLREPPTFESPDDRIAAITVEDGIDEREALIIATAYLYRHITGCGHPGHLRRKGGYWVSRPLLGYSAERAQHRLRIDAVSGAVSWPCGPEFPSPGVRRLLSDGLPRQPGVCARTPDPVVRS